MAMDLTTYTGLQAAISSFLNRGDADTLNAIPGFIALAEARMQRDIRRKTVRNDAFAIATEATVLPADCAELRSVQPLTGTPTRDRPLKNATPAMLADMRAATAGINGVPRLFAVIDGNIVVSPPPSQSYLHRITYFQKIVPLSGSVASNAVLAEAPDIYLYGALAESAPYLVHDERLPLWDARYTSSVDSLNAKREREETAASLHAARLPVVY